MNLPAALITSFALGATPQTTAPQHVSPMFQHSAPMFPQQHSNTYHYTPPTYH